METCRKVLLAVVWIAGIAGMIGGLIMINDGYSLRPYGIAVLIVSILGSIIGHFLVNVALAIPFILLNNGDYLAAIVPEGKHSGINESRVENTNDETEKSVPVTPLSNNQIKIIRLKSAVGSAILVDIKLDDQTFQIENGGEKIFNVGNGRHKITAFFNDGDDQLEFDINNNSKVINVFIKPPIKIQEV